MVKQSKSKNQENKINAGKFDDIIHNKWPKVKVELEKGVQETKKLVKEGEKHLADLTDKSLKCLRIMVLNHRKEKYFTEIGKLVSSLERTELEANQQITEKLKELSRIDKEIDSLEKRLKE